METSISLDNITPETTDADIRRRPDLLGKQVNRIERFGTTAIVFVEGSNKIEPTFEARRVVLNKENTSIIDSASVKRDIEGR